MHEKMRWSWLMLAVLVTAPLSTPAQVTTDQGAAILLFPKVVADGTFDTLLQIANESSSLLHARCSYALNAPAPADPGSSPPAFTKIDFNLTLTKQQPTHWVASRGRLNDPTDQVCGRLQSTDCDGAGFDPGAVPALPPGFRGELVCVEADAGGAPIFGNDLIGKATLQQLVSGDLASYHAIGVPGLATNNGDNVLCLGGGTSTACPNGSEYASCPDTWILDHPAENAEDPIAGTGSTTTTSITVVPCAQDFQMQTSSSVTLQFAFTNDFEETFTASTSAAFWLDVPLSAINVAFEAATLGATHVQTRIRPMAPSGRFLMVAQRFHTSGGAEPLTTSATLNLHTEGVGSQPDLIVLPSQP